MSKVIGFVGVLYGDEGYITTRQSVITENGKRFLHQYVGEKDGKESYEIKPISTWDWEDYGWKFEEEKNAHNLWNIELPENQLLVLIGPKFYNWISNIPEVADFVVEIKNLPRYKDFRITTMTHENYYKTLNRLEVKLRDVLIESYKKKQINESLFYAWESTSLHEKSALRSILQGMYFYLLGDFDRLSIVGFVASEDLGSRKKNFQNEKHFIKAVETQASEWGIS